MVVKDISFLIPRILVVAGLKCKWCMNEIKIQSRGGDNAGQRYHTAINTKTVRLTPCLLQIRVIEPIRDLAISSQTGQKSASSTMR